MIILRRPRNELELNALHDLRDAVLFLGRGKYNYNRHHPDDAHPDNHFMGLYQEDKLIGTLRLDFIPDGQVIIRRVAIIPDEQNKGYGRMMLAQAHDFAKTRHCTKALSCVSSDAIPFYLKQGYVFDIWDNNADPAIQMSKVLS